MDEWLERRALDLIDEVLEAEPAEQPARLTEAIAANPEVGDLLQRLFRADRAARPALPTEHPALEPGLIGPPPERIGPYRLTRRLGGGGMGEVYLGERDDGLFQQQVAVKLMRPGLLGPAAAEQFAVERAILARLRHPNISQLFDGGADADGRSYIVMELLSGVPVTHHAQTARLSTRETVALLAPICSAVQHAHQANVVHADIKPSNVLIGENGFVKLLDFGIARHVDEAAADQPLAMTAAYASPARRDGERATPADDVYALGALAWELIVGRAPPDNTLPPCASKAITGDIRRAREVAGDLDAVLARACAAAPIDRYQSVEAFADDLQRWGERRPVRARPVGWRGGSVRFVRRHPWASAATAVAVLGLVTAVSVTSLLYIRAEEQRRMAEQRFEDVRGLARYMISDVVERLEGLPGAAPIRRDIAVAGRTYVERLSQTAGGDPGLALEIAVGNGQVGRALGAGSVPSLGDVTAGAAALAAAEDELRRLHRRSPQRDDITLEFARVLTWRGSLIDAAQNDGPVAGAKIAEALRLLDGLIARDSSNTAAQYARWSAVLAQADRWAQENRHAEVIRLNRDMLARAARLPTPPRSAATRPMMQAGLHNTLGDALYYSGDVKGALAEYMAAAQVLEAHRSAGAADVRLIDRLIWSYYNVSSTHSTHGRPAEALVWAEKGSALAGSLLTFDQSARSLRMAQIIELQRAVSLSELGRHGEAIAVAREGVEARRTLSAATPQDYERRRAYAASLRPLGEILGRAGRKAEACGAFTQADAAWADLRRKSPVAPSDDAEIKLVSDLLKAC